MMLAERSANFGELFFAFLLGNELGQHGARAFLVAFQHEEARRLRHKEQQQQKQNGRYGAGQEHIAPANYIEPRIAAA